MARDLDLVRIACHVILYLVFRHGAHIRVWLRERRKLRLDVADAVRVLAPVAQRARRAQLLELCPQRGTRHLDGVGRIVLSHEAAVGA